MAAKKEEKKGTKGTKGSKQGPEIEGPSEGVAPRLREKYRKEIVQKLMDEFKFKNPMQVPYLEKIVINAGLGKSTQNIKIIDQALKDIGAITGQKAVSCKSKKAISNFKLRAGLPIGVMVTLRGDRMYEFLDRLLSVALPRIRDFRGVSDRGFDGRGNYNMGLKDQLIFPEVQYDSAENTFGMNISFITSAQTDDVGRALLNYFGFPFRKRPQQQKAA